MSAPTRYFPSYDFTGFQSANPNTPLPADKLEIEFNNIALTTGETITNLGLIQRSDGRLNNGIVEFDALSNATKALLGTSIVPRGAWAASTAYKTLDMVEVGETTYIAVTDHASGTSFTVDNTSGYWMLWANPGFVDGTSFFQKFSGNGSQTAFTVSQDMGTDENGLMIFINNSGWIPQDPAAYTISGTTLTFAVAPPNASNNIYVFAPAKILSQAAAYAAAAGTSASSAAASATTASTQATNAAASASAAAASATTASTAATNAGNSATAASNSASAAAIAKTNAETAETNAETAQAAAATSATNAAASATTASTQATNAAASATTASTQATNAAASATAAATSATTASTQATNAAASAAAAAVSAAAAAAAVGGYVSTMLSTNTGTQNAIALAADVVNAGGKPIIIPALTYTLNAITISSSVVNLKFMNGAKLVPDSAGGLYRVGTMIQLTNCTVTMDGFYADGQNNGSPICIRQDNGTLKMTNTTIVNFGSTGPLASTVGVYGLIIKGATDVRIDGWTSSNFNDVREGTYGNVIGLTRHILFHNLGHYHLTNAFMTSGDQSSGDDNDFIQFLDDRGASVAMNGTIENVTMRYNGSQRRCLKYQGGFNFADHIDIRRDSTFTPVVNTTNVTGAANNGSGLIRLTVASTTNIITGNKVVVSGVGGTTEANGTWTVTTIDGTHLDLQGSTFTNAYTTGGTANAQTDIGENCMNCIDWASANIGFARVTNSYIDATGFACGFINSGGAGGQIQVSNSKIIGSQLNIIRFNLENLVNNNSATIGMYTVAGDSGSGLQNCEVVGFVKAMVPQGAYNYAKGCTFDDPRGYVFETGDTGKNGFDFMNNMVITRTPGNLSENSRGARLNNVTNVRIYDNSLIQAGNTTHATTFIAALSASATGWVRGNTAPLSPATTPFSVGSSAVVKTLDNNAEPNAESAFADETGALLVPKGTTGQRPSPDVDGYIRYNDTLAVFEGYEAGAWSPLITRTGGYLSTMSPSNTAAQNAAALTADITAADGKTIIVLPGTYNLGETEITGKTINLFFTKGSTLVPDPALFPDNEMLTLSDCQTKIQGLNLDGGHNGAPIAIYAYEGSIELRDTKMVNLGQATGTITTSGVYGLYTSTCDRVVVDGYVGEDFRDISNGIFGDQPGAVRHLFIFNAKTYYVNNVHISGGGEGDDVDFIHFLDTQTPKAMTGTLENAVFRYSHRNRRVLKYQGGYHEARSLDIAPGDDFVASVWSKAVTGAANNGSGLIRLTLDAANFRTGNFVTVAGVTGTTEANGTWVITKIDATHVDLQGSTFTNAYVSGGTAQALTNVGANCITAIDWAANLEGYLRVANSRIDATGFGTAIANSAGVSGTTKVLLEDCEIIAGPYRSIRLNPETGAESNSTTTAFYTPTGDNGSGIRDSVVKGFSRAIALAGDNNFIRNCVIDNPTELAWECGWTTLSYNFDLIGNRVITRTPGYLSVNSFCSRLYNLNSARIFDNALIREGNTTHANIFIRATDGDNTATGVYAGNTAPIGINPFMPSSRDNGIIPIGTDASIRVNTFGNINVGGSATDLMSFDLQPNTLALRGANTSGLNQRGINIVQHGRNANNANAKTLKMFIGGTEILSEALTVSVAGNWRIEVDVIGTAASTQEYYGRATFTGAAGVEYSKTFYGALTLDSTVKQTVKCTGTGVADSDITSEFQKITMF